MEPGEITRIRKSLGETFDEFAERIGVTARTIRRWEGENIKPHPYWIAKLRRLRDETRQKAGTSAG